MKVDTFAPFVANETDLLKAVILGTAQSPGPPPSLEDTYDPKSREHVLNGTYPVEADMVQEMEGFAEVLQRYGVSVYRPQEIESCNQIFARDIGFVIEDKLIRANILPDREREFEAIHHVLDLMGPEHLVHFPEHAHVEGGDVMPWNEYIFIGTYTAEDYPHYITARTNREAVDFIQDLFPHKEVKAFELRKSNYNPKENALHLDCCFQPVGTDKAIMHPDSFLHDEQYEWLVHFFGKENVFEVTQDEMYHMFCNVFSISPEVVVSEQNFTRLNTWLREKGFTVEEIPYGEIAKQEGLLRCSTLPSTKR